MPFCILSDLTWHSKIPRGTRACGTLGWNNDFSKGNCKGKGGSAYRVGSRLAHDNMPETLELY